MATERTYYEILGIERNATDADIKRAFRKLAQQWHPDVNTDAAAPAQFKEINEAYQVLSDPKRRQIYDMVGKDGLGDMGGAGIALRRGVPGLRRPVRRLLRGHGRECRRGSARAAAVGLGPALRPAHQFRRGGPGRREGDRVRPAGSMHDLRRDRSDARQHARDLHDLRRPRRDPQRSPDAARADGQRHGLHPLQRRGPRRRLALPGLPRRWPRSAPQEDQGHDPGRYRRGPPDPALRRGRDRPAKRTRRQPVRGGSRNAARPAPTQRAGDLLRPRSVDRAGGAREREPEFRPSKATKNSKSAAALSPGPRSGSAAAGFRICAGRASAATST